MSGPRDYRIDYFLTELSGAAQINAALLQQYAAVRDSAALRRSHFFAGRHENIYVPEEQLPALAQVLAAARRGARQFLRGGRRRLAVGFWLNEMGPGQRTLPHSHDEADELASAVYYVRVPERSGELILRQGVAETRVSPVEGMFVFFPPHVVHEVSENRSGQTRLSIGMNFGVRRAAMPE